METMKRWARKAFTTPTVTVTMTSDESTQSQGLIVNEETGSAVNHSSTSPPNFYKMSYRMENGVNMDRGGVVHETIGNTNSGCVFDGVTSGGVVNLYAAQAFAQYTLRWLAENQSKINRQTVGQLGVQCFQAATRRDNNPGLKNPQHDAEGGSATGMFVTVEHDYDDLFLHGLSLGDVIGLLVTRDTGAIVQLNSFVRRNHSARDSGGQLGMCLGLDGEAYAFSFPANPNDIVILATDGLLDNIAEGLLCSVVLFVISCPFFDTEQATPCETTVSLRPHLPSIPELAHLTSSHERVPLGAISTVEAARRLSNYVHWVTKNVYDLEQTYYGLHLRLQDLGKLVQSDENPGVQQEIDVLKQQLRSMEESKRTVAIGKTDDCLVVVFQPCS